MKDHGSVIPASGAVCMVFNDFSDILTYASSARIDPIVAYHAFDEHFCKACGHAAIISGDEGQMVNS